MNKYLARYAEPEVLELTSFPAHHPYQHVVCMPAFRETPACLSRLIALANQQAQSILLVLVINQPDDYLDAHCNTPLVEAVEAGEQLWQSVNTHLKLHAFEKLHCLSVRRYEEGYRIPRKQGVGLARKIACDIATTLIAKNMIKDTKIFSTDADTLLPTTYFNTCLPAKHSAAVFSFQHLPSDDNALHEATQIYEKSLHAYVDGLKQAQSPYAFHTIGSCLLIDAVNYCKVRGFPKRAGAEDFYLLNKLQKIQPVYSLESPALHITARLSSRVPFGTGPATASLLSGDKDPLSLFYSAQSYRFLSLWLKYLDFLMEEDQMKEDQMKKGQSASIEAFASKTVTSIHGSISEKNKQALHAMRIYFSLNTITHKIITNFTSHKQRKKAIHDWFDAFKTLKLIRTYKPLILGTLESSSFSASSLAISGIKDETHAE